MAATLHFEWNVIRCWPPRSDQRTLDLFTHHCNMVSQVALITQTYILSNSRRNRSKKRDNATMFKRLYKIVVLWILFQVFIWISIFIFYNFLKLFVSFYFTKNQQPNLCIWECQGLSYLDILDIILTQFLWIHL